MLVTLCKGVTVATGAPSAVTDGRPLWKGMGAPAGKGFLYPNDGFQRDVDEALLVLENTAGDVVALSITYARVWGRVASDPSDPDARIWVPLGTGTAADKGKLNKHDVAGTPTFTIASVADGQLVHMERIRGFGECDRLFLELGVFSGANLAVRGTLQAYTSRPVR